MHDAYESRTTARLWPELAPDPDGCEPPPPQAARQQPGNGHGNDRRRRPPRPDAARVAAAVVVHLIVLSSGAEGPGGTMFLCGRQTAARVSCEFGVKSAGSCAAALRFLYHRADGKWHAWPAALSRGEGSLILTPRGGRKPTSLGLTTGSGQSGYPWARMHRITFSSLVSAATSCASVNGSCEGAVRASPDAGPATAAPAARRGEQGDPGQGGDAVTGSHCRPSARTGTVVSWC